MFITFLTKTKHVFRFRFDLLVGGRVQKQTRVLSEFLRSD